MQYYNSKANIPNKKIAPNKIALQSRTYLFPCTAKKVM